MPAAVEDREFTGLQRELAELAQRVAESGAAQQQTQERLDHLAQSVAEVVARDRVGERRSYFNSFVAYLLFTVLLGGAFFALYRSRAGGLVAARDQAIRERDAAQSDVAALVREGEERRAAEVKARQFLDLLWDDKMEEALVQFPEIERLPLSPAERALFAREVAKARREIVETRYRAGVSAFRRKDHDVAVRELRRALAYPAAGPEMVQARYYLGVSLNRRGEHRDAVRQLELALAKGAEQLGMDDGRYYLAASLEQLGRLEEARMAYERFAAEHPERSLAGWAQRRAEHLARAAGPSN